MPHITTFLILTFLAFLTLVSAAPVPVSHELSEDGQTLERRGGSYSGRITWYHPGTGNKGNCGYYDNDKSPAVALSTKFYKSKYCNQWIELVNTKTKKKARGKIRDSCPTCGKYDLDLSPSVFKQLAPLGKGVDHVQWHFV